MTEDYHTPSSKCTNCGKELDGAMSIEHDNAPSPGDITICMKCSHVMAFADDLTLRELTDDEVKEVAEDINLVCAIEGLGGMATPEGKVKDGIKKVLNEHKVYYFMPVQMGYGPGGLDFHCVVTIKDYPLAFFIEAKKPGEEPTPRQIDLITKLTEVYKCKVWVIDKQQGIDALELWLRTITEYS